MDFSRAASVRMEDSKAGSSRALKGCSNWYLGERGRRRQWTLDLG